MNWVEKMCCMSPNHYIHTILLKTLVWNKAFIQVLKWIFSTVNTWRICNEVQQQRVPQKVSFFQGENNHVNLFHQAAHTCFVLHLLLKSFNRRKAKFTVTQLRPWNTKWLDFRKKYWTQRGKAVCRFSPTDQRRGQPSIRKDRECIEHW